MGAAGDHPLADARELLDAAGVDRPGTRAVLAGHLADARVDAETAQRSLDDPGDQLEALLGARDRSRMRACPGDSKRALVKDRRSATGQSDHGLEAGLAGRSHGSAEAGGNPVLLGEGELPGGSVQPQRCRSLAGGDALQDRVRNRRAKCGAVGKSLPEQA